MMQDLGQDEGKKKLMHVKKKEFPANLKNSNKQLFTHSASKILENVYNWDVNFEKRNVKDEFYEGRDLIDNLVA